MSLSQLRCTRVVETKAKKLFTFFHWIFIFFVKWPQKSMMDVMIVVNRMYKLICLWINLWSKNFFFCQDHQKKERRGFYSSLQLWTHERRCYLIKFFCEWKDVKKSDGGGFLSGKVENLIVCEKMLVCKYPGRLVLGSSGYWESPSQTIFFTACQKNKSWLVCTVHHFRRLCDFWRANKKCFFVLHIFFLLQ